MATAAASDRAAYPAHLTTVADLDAAMRARGDARRQRDAEQKAKRRASRRAAQAAHATHLITMPRMAALAEAGAMLGGAEKLAAVLGIDPRSLRKKAAAERGISNDDLTAAAAALEARAERLTAHALKLRQEAGQ